ncbi:hypothetical protein ROZALSC1DRAFT_30612 [Rozella allomycis CSF55]|uniref:Uncharacterized protein n=1 Tax=Rozella allomycis (strain CSF55) TaxID=988480 RepID=A0A075B1K9_ROZAC|nr:hypothetical protein O9G_003868 [Rozella allomycis CSF55]RKP17603.1 hypothetical protein ROZALSC1DRAFT_30612 [Rozella allomycis CSF55]|eukprot:EPZ36243.1 hypothetical protein O9G_003868 [Rozella allomycis CSF55]
MPLFLKIGPPLQKAIDIAVQIDSIPSTLKSDLSLLCSHPESTCADYTEHYISVSLLSQLSEFLISHERKFKTEEEIERSPYWLHELCKSSSFYFPEQKVSRSKSLQEMLDKAQLKVDTERYESMIRSASFHGYSEMTIRSPGEIDEGKLVKRQMTAILNILFSFVGCIVAVMWAFRNVIPDVGTRVILALIVGMIVLFAEVWLYSRHFHLA